MYGDLGGILGNKLEKVEYLELESGDFLEKNS
jgi:hypothetical protein